MAALQTFRVRSCWRDWEEPWMQGCRHGVPIPCVTCSDGFGRKNILKASRLESFCRDFCATLPPPPPKMPPSTATSKPWRPSAAHRFGALGLHGRSAVVVHLLCARLWLFDLLRDVARDPFTRGQSPVESCHCKSCSLPSYSEIVCYCMVLHAVA